MSEATKSEIIAMMANITGVTPTSGTTKNAIIAMATAVKSASDFLTDDGHSRIFLDMGDDYNYMVFPPNYDRKADPDNLQKNISDDSYQAPFTLTYNAIAKISEGVTIPLMKLMEDSAKISMEEAEKLGEAAGILYGMQAAGYNPHERIKELSGLVSVEKLESAIDALAESFTIGELDYDADDKAITFKMTNCEHEITPVP